MTGAVLIILGVTATVFGVNLFTQRFPAIPTTSVVLVTNCNDPTELAPSPSQLSVGLSGSIRFTCGSDAAFRVAITGSATPAFTLPTEYNRFSIMPRLADCHTSFDYPLTSGNVVNFGGGGQWDYCAYFSNAPATGLPGFSITWSAA